MRRLVLSIAAALIAGVASASPAPPGQLYVRGAFNGWGTDLPLRQAGNGTYEASALIAPGYHPFKLGSADWRVEWVPSPSGDLQGATGTAYRVATAPGPEGFMLVREAGTYRFVLDTSQKDGPTLSVERLAASRTAQADPHPAGSVRHRLEFDTWRGGRKSATFSATGGTLRTYTHSTTAPLRDPGPGHVRYSERAALPRVRSGSVAFDALFALAVSEAQQNAVSKIADGNYNGGQPVPCECFETGDKWHYVWTRDLSYAADLGLALLDPQRVRNSLEFKLSGYRAGVQKPEAAAGSPDGLQIIQDTGSGGSWPVSTDRASWAFGAQAALDLLAPGERKAFGATALKALVNTIENDRIAAYDPGTGLYRGEQSFLDWREQSYASWIPDDLASMATSFALSTNVAHYKALALASQLAREHGDATTARRYDAWARDLKQAINAKFWLAGAGMYSSLSAGHFDSAPMYKFDWLGQSLAIVTGVADSGQAASILARYPHGPMGPPVIFPQQPGRPVYHNRALWPFVTAYGLKAAALHGNVAVADAAYESLVRGAALHLSNMENLEWASGQAMLLDERDPALSGPVINSRRQLWSVGAYVGMVVGQVFGIEAHAGGIDVRPFVTARLARTTLRGGRQADLLNLSLRGHRIDVRLHLPPAEEGAGVYAVRRIRLNGRETPARIGWHQLADQNTIEVELGAPQPGQQAITRVSATPHEQAPAAFAPPDPMPPVLSGAGQALRLQAVAPPGTTLNVFRDGRQVAEGVRGSWTDPAPVGGACYAVEAVYPSSGNRSHHSPPSCMGPDLALPGVPPSPGWGAPADTLSLGGLSVGQRGRYAVQLRYRNSANQVNLGISNAVKWIAVRDGRGRLVASGVVQMPHTAAGRTGHSTPLIAVLEGGQSYRIELSDFYNMSYLDGNASFTGAGGSAGPWNRADILGVRVRELAAGR